MSRELTGRTLESGIEVKEGDLLFTKKSMKCGVVRELYPNYYVVLFSEKGHKVSGFRLEDCLHLKHVGNIVDNPNGVK